LISKRFSVGLKVLRAMVMKIYAFWDIIACSPSKISQHFGGTCCLHLQGQRISQARNQQEAGS
jgi:hypothetical protein